MKQFLIGNNVNASKQNYFWNFLSSGLIAGQSALLPLIISIILGNVDTGIVSIAFSIGATMFCLATYNIRNYQVTDISRRLSFHDYLYTRCITVFVVTLIGSIYIFYRYGMGYKAIIIFILCVMKLWDAFEDVLHGELQRSDLLYVGAKIEVIHIVFSLILFMISMICSKNLLFSCFVMVCGKLILSLYLNKHILPLLYLKKEQCNWEKVWRLLKECVPLCISAFLYTYLCNSSKYAIDSYLTEELQGIFAILILPAFVINLMAQFVFNPILVKIAMLWDQEKYKELLNYIIKLLLFLFVLVFIVIISAYLVGIQVLSFVFVQNLSVYKTEFIILIIGGAMTAIVCFLTQILITIRSQNAILIAYIFSCIIVKVISRNIILGYGLLGACILYGVGFGLTALILGLVTVNRFRVIMKDS